MIMTTGHVLLVGGGGGDPPPPSELETTKVDWAGGKFATITAQHEVPLPWLKQFLFAVKAVFLMAE